MISSFTGGLCVGVFSVTGRPRVGSRLMQPRFNQTFPRLTLSVKLPHLNAGWKTSVVMVLCWPGYTFNNVTGTGTEVIVQVEAGAVAVLFSGHLRALIIICPDGMWLHKV